MLDVVQGSEEWRMARLGKVTASRIADVMAKGRSGQPSATRANYLAELVTERLSGIPNDGFKSAAMERGNEVEPEARQAYAFAACIQVAECGFCPHPTIADTGASPDGRVGSKGLVQIKCPNTATHIASIMNGKVDRAYMLQMQWEMACDGRTWCDFASFDPRLPEPMQLYVKRIERDDKLIAEIANEVTAFLAEVADTVEALRKRFSMPGPINYMMAG